MSNSYNIYDIDALVMLNVIKANTVCVKVYLLFLTCSMTNPSKKSWPIETEEGLLCWIISPNTEPQLVHSSMHTVKIIFIQTTLLNIDIWCRNADVFFLLILFSHSHVQFYCHSLFPSSFILLDFDFHHTKLPLKLRSSQSGSIRPGSHCLH